MPYSPGNAAVVTPAVLQQTTYAAGAKGAFSSNGLLGGNNVGTPGQLYDVEATGIVVANPLTQTSYFLAAPVRTVDKTLAGPVVNGRDQAAAFNVSTWLHLYWIYNPTTLVLATTVSLALPTVGPALPAGFTAWGYIGPIRNDAAGNFLNVTMVANAAYYRDQGGTWNVLNAGTAGTETAISTAAFCPPNARTVDFNSYFGVNGGALGGQYFADIRIYSGSLNSYTTTTAAIGAGATTNVSTVYNFTCPNVNQNIYYLIRGVPPANGASLFITAIGYDMPNGGA